MSDFTYETGLKHSKTYEKEFIASDIVARERYVNYLKDLAAKYNDQYFSGIADGLWREGTAHEKTNCFDRRRRS